MSSKAGAATHTELLQIDVYPPSDDGDAWTATEPGVSAVGRGEDGLEAAIHYLEFLRDSQPADD